MCSLSFFFFPHMTEGFFQRLKNSLSWDMNICKQATIKVWKKKQPSFYCLLKTEDQVKPLRPWVFDLLGLVTPLKPTSVYVLFTYVEPLFACI